GGYFASVLAMEQLHVDDAVASLITDGASRFDISAHARVRGMTSLRQAALALAAAGATSVVEALLVTPLRLVRAGSTTRGTGPGRAAPNGNVALLRRARRTVARSRRSRDPPRRRSCRSRGPSLRGCSPARA